ncbi:MAG: hypothetical protein Q4C30_01035, partial [Bacteroidia bacterium]|nr:hypothetical protein [Bacteroidia bacterium]
MSSGMSYRLFVLVIALSIIYPCFAQQGVRKNGYEMQSDMPFFETYMQDLPSPIINDVLEDEEGFVWASTNNGIVRFDGLTYTMYGEEAGARNFNGIGYYKVFESKANNSIVAIRKDGMGFLSIDKTTKEKTVLTYKNTIGDDVSLVASNPSLAQYDDTTLLVLVKNVLLNRVDLRTGVVFATDSIRIAKRPNSASRLVESN